jgi:hypothetical protein
MNEISHSITQWSMWEKKRKRRMIEQTKNTNKSLISHYKRKFTVHRSYTQINTFFQTELINKISSTSCYLSQKNVSDITQLCVFSGLISDEISQIRPLPAVQNRSFVEACPLVLCPSQGLQKRTK